MSTPNFSVIISNYNHAAYITESVDSALGQTFPAAEIILVDDGSTDESLEVINRAYAANPRVKIISQHNCGQIAAIAAGIAAAEGDICCFLDSDDTLHPDYLREIAATYENNPLVDTLFCSFRLIGRATENLSSNDVVWPRPSGNYDYGYTSLLTCFGGKMWIGNLTSTISMKTKLARMLGLDELASSWDFSLSADYVILLGSSILGGRKYYLDKPLVNYRLHGTNGVWIPEKKTGKSSYKRRMLQHIALGFFKKKAGIRDSAYQLLNEEISTIPNPLPEHLQAYKKMKRHLRYKNGELYSHASWLRKLGRTFRIWKRSIRN